jgi:ParB family chromosome partitioning protein
MGSGTADKMGAEGRMDVYYINPDHLVLVMDPKSELYDERMELPLNEALVADIFENGVQQTVQVRRNGSDKNGHYLLEVIDGRQRVRSCREANKRRVAAGLEPHLVKTELVKGTPDEIFEQMVRLNQFRQSDSPVMLARKAQRYMARGHDAKKASTIFGLNVKTLEKYLELLDLVPEVQKMVEDRRLTIGVALELASVPMAGQAEAAVKLIESGAVRGDAARFAVEEARGPEAGPVEAMTSEPIGQSGKNPADKATDKPKKPTRVKPSPAEITAVVDSIEPKPQRYDEGVRDALLWVLGEKSDVPKEWSEVLKAHRAEVKKKAAEKAANKAAKAA